MKKAQFKGYILEEVLAYLLRNSGYKLISQPNGDPFLSLKHNGLNVKGRGTYHQIDVLGEFKWNPFFTNPIRLGIEAKFKGKTQGVDVVRNAVGILKDINENHFPTEYSRLYNRYQYSIAIFSTSGFTKEAVDMAIAHNVVLIDLDDEVYQGIIASINEFADSVFHNQTDISSDAANVLRSQLRNFFNNVASEDDSLSQVLQVITLVNYIKGRKIILGMTKGGYAIILFSDDIEDFIKYSKKNRNHDISISWEKVNNGVTWTIQPYYNDNNPRYMAKFKLPNSINEIIKESVNIRTDALNLKNQHLGTITIYYCDDIDYIFNLTYKSLPTM